MFNVNVEKIYKKKFCFFWLMRILFVFKNISSECIVEEIYFMCIIFVIFFID